MRDKSIIYSYREDDKKRGKLLFTNDKTLEKNYPNSFGVSKSAMEQKLSIEDIKTSKSLPSSAEPKVIIVGNSPDVLKNEYGSLIDSYDIVIRINKCVTKNYEKYVGSKIDIWATTYNRAAWYGENFIPENYQNITQLWVRTQSTKLDGLPKNLKSLNRIQMYKSGFWRSQENKEVRSYLGKHKLKAEPCTGLLTILTATRFYKDITLYGFSFFDESGGLIRDYYALDKSSISEVELKNYEREENLKTGKKGKHFFSSDQKEAKLNILKELELNNKIKFLK